MLRLQCLLCSCLVAISLCAHADDTQADDSKAVVPATHRQGKFARRAGNATNPNEATNKNGSLQEQTVGESHEHKAMSKEERRALRRQINESVGKYPRRR